MAAVSSTPSPTFSPVSTTPTDDVDMPVVSDSRVPKHRPRPVYPRKPVRILRPGVCTCTYCDAVSCGVGTGAPGTFLVRGKLHVDDDE